jgi:hypothetical protein
MKRGDNPRKNTGNYEYGEI